MDISTKEIFENHCTYRIGTVENYYCKILSENNCLFEKKVESFHDSCDSTIKHKYVYHKECSEKENCYELNDTDLIFRTSYHINGNKYIMYDKIFFHKE